MEKNVWKVEALSCYTGIYCESKGILLYVIWKWGKRQLNNFSIVNSREPIN